MNQLCREAWETDFNLLEKERFAETGGSKCAIRKRKKILIKNAALKRHLSDFIKFLFN